jgi:zinc protease
MSRSIIRAVSLGFLVCLATPSFRAQAVRSEPDASREPPIQRFSLSNGLAVWVVEHHDLPIVQLSLVALRGTGDEPPGRYGIASLASALLTAGTESRSALQIADAIDRLKGNLAPAGGVDSSSLQLHVPVAGLADALPIVADAIQHPAFPAEAFEHVRQERLLALQQSRDNPDAIAALAFSRVVYGASHRYGTALIGAANTISAFVRNDLADFHASAYRPATSTLLVVGDVRPDEVMKLLETHFGGWRASGSDPDRATPSLTAPPAQRRIVLVDLPRAPQSRILVGGVGAPRATADFFPIQVMNSVFRTRLTARLGAAAAGVRSGFDMRKGPGPFVAAAAVRADATAGSLAALNAVAIGMEDMASDDEIARAKADVVSHVPTFESTGRLTARLQSLESILVYGLPDDYYSTYASEVERVGAADVRRVARQYLRPDRLVIVVVGDLESVEPGIRALNAGPISRMTIDEVFAPAAPVR